MAPAGKLVREKHRRYGERLPPTPFIGGIPAHRCILREPLCPYIILAEKGIPRCRMYAVPIRGKEKSKLAEVNTIRCYFYAEWRRTGIVAVLEQEENQEKWPRRMLA
jgi:hypothetical protein